MPTVQLTLWSLRHIVFWPSKNTTKQTRLLERVLTQAKAHLNKLNEVLTELENHVNTSNSEYTSAIRDQHSAIVEAAARKREVDMYDEQSRKVVAETSDYMAMMKENAKSRKKELKELPDQQDLVHSMRMELQEKMRASLEEQLATMNEYYDALKAKDDANKRTLQQWSFS
eukprot:TRINITY_DN1046_c0_g1_i2.p1 TRINITY_DN1046_c0_g1~~TRINITY_DN1046_c0_g1_i2.p1  ORF type:complete len:171 (-),score=25.34 TRINITY_DN1046_c0_g1_i2:63-575(-)